MNIVRLSSLDRADLASLLARPAASDDAERRERVAAIIAQVRQYGDEALAELTGRFDGVTLSDFAISVEAIDQSGRRLGADERSALERAYATIRRFHLETGRREMRVETAPGVVCQRLVRAIERVGLYVPGGSAPLPSTALMLGVPAQLAECAEVVLCTPPNADGEVAPSILYAAKLCGIENVFRIGGAQAIAAMAYSTASVPKVDKIFGPGNAWVTEAKQQVSRDPAGAAQDLPAGPSELLVVADADADPVIVAADLLSQAEHGPDSQVILLTLDEAQARACVDATLAQLDSLPRAAIARRALEKSRVLVCESRDTALAVINDYAPEHLLINTVDADDWLAGVQNAGSVFLGSFTPESLGDYCSGTNHVLPTYGHARVSGGLSVADFQKSFTVQRASAEGLAMLGPVASKLAGMEGLEAHARAVTLRLDERTGLDQSTLAAAVRERS
ncbi:MAG: histidinol dehydrogenase [Gammaproteobacteria bacterium]|nr:histidinol dehydrogenase [Gammaproteobacteria bacterium]